jgi:hypothetical protein
VVFPTRLSLSEACSPSPVGKGLGVRVSLPLYRARRDALHHEALGEEVEDHHG